MLRIRTARLPASRPHDETLGRSACACALCAFNRGGDGAARVMVADAKECGEGVSFFGVRKLLLADVPSTAEDLQQRVGHLSHDAYRCFRQLRRLRRAIHDVVARWLAWPCAAGTGFSDQAPDEEEALSRGARESVKFSAPREKYITRFPQREKYIVRQYQEREAGAGSWHGQRIDSRRGTRAARPASSSRMRRICRHSYDGEVVRGAARRRQLRI